MTIGAEEVRAIVLREFAALTRHKPAALDGNFGCQLEGDGPVRISVTFGGKRRASTECAAQALEWSAERFAEEICKPLARDLFASA